MQVDFMMLPFGMRTLIDGLFVEVGLESNAVL